MIRILTGFIVVLVVGVVVLECLKPVRARLVEKREAEKTERRVAAVKRANAPREDSCFAKKNWASFPKGKAHSRDISYERLSTWEFVRKRWDSEVASAVGRLCVAEASPDAGASEEESETSAGNGEGRSESAGSAE